MPIYEYICPTCGHEEEVLQSIDALNIKCHVESKGYFCNTEMNKKISKSSVIFKGEGFYETDYKKKKKSNIKKEKPISTPKSSNDTTES